MSDSQLEAIDQLLEQPEPVKSAPQSQQEQLAAIDDLLSGNPAEEPTAAEQGGDTSTDEEAEAAPDTEKDDGVDYSLEVPLRDGTKVPLGELKDAYQEAQQRTLAMQERENAINARMLEVNDLAQHVQLPPQQVEAIRQQQERYLQQQHELMLQVMPELNDKATFGKVKQGIMNLAEQYGVQDIVANVTDHRVVKLLNDFVQLRDSIKAAKDNVKPLRSKDPKAQQKAVGKPDAATQLEMRAKQTRSQGDQLAAIDALLKR